MKQVEPIETVNRKIFAILARMEGRSRDMARDMMTKHDMSRIDQRFNGIAGQLDGILDQLKPRRRA